MSDRDEFYIGYEAGMPPGMARVVRRLIVTTVAAAVAIATLWVFGQRRLADARFEFGVARTFSGYLALSPAPVLLVMEDEVLQRHWLVGGGKFGAAAALGDVKPGWVTLSGTLVERERWRMIEVIAGSVRPVASTAPPPEAAADPGRRVERRGEIVDSKCYLGVMNPGERTVHRDCAVRCLSGGVPPMFAYRDESGSHLALLLGLDEENWHELAGRPITLEGWVSGPEEALVFRTATQR